MGLLTGCIPQSELHGLVIHSHLMHMVLEDGRFATGASRLSKVGNSVMPCLLYLSKKAPREDV